MPDPHAIAVMALTLFALILFTRDRIPLETSAFIVLCLLTLGFAVFPYSYVDLKGATVPVHAVDFFHGFGHEALIAVCALMVVGTGLVKTGALEPVGHMLSRMWKVSPSLSLLTTLLIAAGLSAFINNTPIVVLLIPILVSVALKTKSNPAALLMPMGFASLIGGMGTTIGTSTNLLVVSVASDLGLAKMGVFDFFLPALLGSVVGIAFLWLIAPRMLPKRDLPLSDASNRMYTAQLLVTEESSAVGKTIMELKQATNGELSIDKVRRSETSYILPLPDVIIRAGDKILVHDTPAQLKSFEKATDTVLYAKNQRVDEDHPLNDDDQIIIEIIIDQRSPLLGRTLQSTRFIENYKMIALAVHRHGDKIREMPTGLGNLSLRLGDIILAQGKREDIDTLKSEHEFLVLDSTIELPLSKKAPLSIIIMLLVVALAATKAMPIAVSAMLGVLAMLLTKCLSWNDVSRSLNIPVIMIVVSSLALGQAMTVTGASVFIANGFVGVTEGFSPPFILSGLILLMAIFTNVVSNNAAAVIGTPIAVSIATTLGLNPEPFVLAVLFGANMSYATPMAYKTNLLIMSAGNYTFSDFLRVGVPLSVIMWLAYSIILPMMYSL